MNIRLRSAQSRRDAVRKGLIGYLGAGIERGDLANDLVNDLADDGSSPHPPFSHAAASAGEHRPTADAMTSTAPLTHPPST